ncbi:cell division protein FtsL [Serratia symbiotica]|uniref:Cell division protein FtsL n=1 Tax=Serratia symbiotica TaxID=138074 RepID=A0A068YV31_9GAMM|nr:cell division protein FtsL [Serratia symbiotica]MBF1994285.1 cell division protein FtsL [Serratia symbiotica]MBQ0954751.1 cell division protein FtsL [Serratia symbiotica]QLH63778.1 cell division protein FtsL [Serratia symbiotica]QTP14169.1 cell division protein FtsL [Serratia symbiotica]CDS55562.1 membrane bound cell division protein at septum containing leucine zipper motif [Serratia symbiotica]
MIGNQRLGLVGVIGGDLLRNAKIPLILLVAVLVSAIFVVTTVHRTRLLTAEREQLVLERDALDIEWRNLILEENALGAHSRVERIATEKLQMQHVDLSQENIIVKQ